MSECNDTGVLPLGSISRSEMIRHRLQQKSPFPLSVMMSLTGRCNARCRHCELLLEHEDCDELSFDEISSILKQLQDANVLSLTFTGGEPCLRNDLVDIVADAVLKRFYVTLKTNGTMIDNALVEALVDAGLGGAHISIYHDVPVLHDEFVGIEGAWSSAIAAAERLRKSQVRVQLSLVAMNWNADAVPRLVDLCEARRLAYMLDTQIAPRHGNDRSLLCYQASKEQIASLFRDPRLLNRAFFTASPRRIPDDPVCGAAVHSCYIHHNGEMRPCGRLPFRMGNLTSENFKEVWLTSKVRKQVQGIRWRQLPLCGSCERSGLCSRCLFAALSSDGAFLGPDPRECEAAKALSAVVSERDHAKIDEI